MAKVKYNDKKVNRSEYLTRVSKRTGIDRKIVLTVYDGLIDELVEIMQNNQQLLLTGFGNFYVQKHKGHPVQFSGGKDIVSDYNVLKFSPSNIMKKRVRSGNSQDENV